MNIQYLQKKNPSLNIQAVNTTEFKRYGRRLALDAQPMISYVKEHFILPKDGSSYEANLPQLHAFSLSAVIQKEIYGELAIEVGICHGHNTVLTGLEYHMGSEVNVAVTDCLLALGRKEELVEERIDGSQLQVFYIPAGTIIELYEGTLHYCPFSAVKSGFSTIVILLDQTNTTISYHRGSLLTKRNKWFLAHVDNTAKIEAGNVAGLTGEALKINL